MDSPVPGGGISTNDHIAEINNVQHGSRVRSGLSRKASESPAKVDAAAKAACPKRTRLENGSAKGVEATSPTRSPVRRLLIRAGGTIARAAGAHDRPSSNGILLPPLIRRPTQTPASVDFLSAATRQSIAPTNAELVNVTSTHAYSSNVAQDSASSQTSIAALANAAQANKKKKKQKKTFVVPASGFMTWMREAQILEFSEKRIHRKAKKEPHQKY